MGVPAPEMNPADEASAESLLSSLRTIAAGERRKHATVYNYWLSIKRDRDFPPIHDLDPLEISDAGAFSLLLEMIGGGEDAEIRHIGQAIKAGIDVQKVGEAPNPSLLSKIATRLPVVAACREAFAFEDEFETADGKTRCWVTLLPFSETGTWIDYVYGFVSLDAPGAAASDAQSAEAVGDLAEVLKLADSLAAADDDPVEPEPVEAGPAVEAIEESVGSDPEPELQAEPVEEAPKAGFSAKLFEKLASAGGFYGKPVEMDMDAFEVVVPEQTGKPAEAESQASPEPEPEAVAELEPEAEAVIEPEPEPEAAIEPEPEFEREPVADGPAEAVAAEPEATPEFTSTSEGVLHNKLAEVRAKADEARQAKLRANTALYEGLSAAYDFALDAEDKPEEYLKLVEAQGLKIQLRSPMKPVAKLAFDGMCDDVAIKQLEAILAWAFDEELPRGTLAGRIEAAGGIGPILSGEARAA